MNLRHFTLLLSALSLTASLHAQFTDCFSDLTLVSQLPLNGNYAVPASDGAGGAVFRFHASDFGQLEGRGWCQRMSAEGYRMWGDSGRVAAQSVANQVAMAGHPDGKGGYYLSWTENRFISPPRNRFAQHFDAAGNRLWEPTGKYLGEGLTLYADESACTLSDGSMAIALNSNNTDAVTYFQVHRYLPNGTPSWTAPLDTLTAGFSPKLVADDAGGVFVSWQVNDALNIQYIDFQGKTWAAPKIFAQAAYYWCHSKPSGIFVGFTSDGPTGYEFNFQRYDQNGVPQYPQPGKKVSFVGFLSSISPTQTGGFYMEHQSHISKIASNGNLLWQTTLPNGINLGQFSVLLEPAPDTLIATYSANGMIAFDTQGEVMWTKAGNPLFGDPFGLTGACVTADKRFITSQFGADAGSRLYAFKWNLDGTLYTSETAVAYALSGPDSVYVGDTATLLLTPDSASFRIETWLSSTDSLAFLPVPNSAQQDTLLLSDLSKTTWFKVVVRRGMTCFDTIGLQKIVVIPVSSQTEVHPATLLWKVAQNGSALLLSGPCDDFSAPIISLYDMGGRAVFSEKTVALTHDGEYVVSLPMLPAGAYAYRIHSKKGVQAGKVWLVAD